MKEAYLYNATQKQLNGTLTMQDPYIAFKKYLLKEETTKNILRVGGNRSILKEGRLGRITSALAIAAMSLFFSCRPDGNNQEGRNAVLQYSGKQLALVNNEDIVLEAKEKVKSMIDTAYSEEERENIHYGIDGLDVFTEVSSRAWDENGKDKYSVHGHYYRIPHIGSLGKEYVYIIIPAGVFSMAKDDAEKGTNLHSSGTQGIATSTEKIKEILVHEILHYTLSVVRPWPGVVNDVSARHGQHKSDLKDPKFRMSFIKQKLAPNGIENEPLHVQELIKETDMMIEKHANYLSDITEVAIRGINFKIWLASEGKLDNMNAPITEEHYNFFIDAVKQNTELSKRDFYLYVILTEPK